MKRIQRYLLGFFGGLFIAFLLFFSMIFQLDYSLSLATYVTAFVSLPFVVAMTFCRRLQCLVLLAMPQFFSKRGRSAMIAYVFLITFTGPIQNMAKNTEILSASMSCGQVGEFHILFQPFKLIQFCSLN